MQDDRKNMQKDHRDAKLQRDTIITAKRRETTAEKCRITSETQNEHKRTWSGRNEMQKKNHKDANRPQWCEKEKQSDTSENKEKQNNLRVTQDKSKRNIQ